MRPLPDVVFEARTLARVLMVGDPIQGEEAEDVFLLPELRRVVDAGSGVVSLRGDDGETWYISILRGVRTTSHEAPTWADPAEIVALERPNRSNAVRKRFERALGDLAALDDAAAAALGLARAAEAIAPYYEHPRADLWSADGAKALADTGAADLLRKTAVPEDSCLTVLNEILHRHLGFGIVGFAAHPIVATFAMLNIVPDILPAALGSARAFALHALEEGGAATEDASSVILSPSDVGTWADILDSVTDGFGWRLALAGARILRSHGDSARDRARDEVTFEAFHLDLCEALLTYLSADWLYSECLKLSANDEQKSEAASARRFIEEMRARILTSLQWAAGFTVGPNFSRPDEVDGWVLTLAEMTPQEGRREIADLRSQLTFPDVVADLAIARLELIHGDERGQRRAEKVMTYLLEHENLVRVLDGAAFLGYAEWILQNGTTQFADHARA
jgi:hypothetical protein